jgi:cation:H+ antiporter
LGVEADAVAFAAGAVVSLSTSWLLVSRLERLGKRLGLSEASLGLLAALAADSPEVTSAITALLHGEHSVGAGVVLGSNVFNLAALLGSATVVAGWVALHRRVVVLNGSVATWTAVVSVLAVTGRVSALVGLVLVLVVLVPYVLIVSSSGRRALAALVPRRWAAWIASAVTEEESELEPAIHPRRGRVVDAWIALGALVTVVGASVVMARSAVAIGRHFSVSGVVIGALLLAAVTSLPNAVAAVYLASRNRGAATMSTALNSNTLNVVAGLLVPAAILGIGAQSAHGSVEVWWYLAMTLVAVSLAYLRRGLGRRAGALLIAGYLSFVAVVLAM